jgi:hypothetical protein
MQMKLKRIAIEFNEYYQSDDEFVTKLRFTLEWDDKEYEKLAALIRGVLVEYAEEPVIPKILIYFFNLDLSLIEGIVSNPLFIKNPPEPYNRDDYKQLIDSRIKELNIMKSVLFGKNINLLGK